MKPTPNARTPRLAGFKTECAIHHILDSARSIDLAEARARRCGQDPDAARSRALQRFQATVKDEYRRLSEASRRVVWRRVLAALAHPADATEAVIRQLRELREAHRAEQLRLMGEPWSIEIAEARRDGGRP